MLKIQSPIRYIGAKSWIVQILLHKFSESGAKTFIDCCAGGMSASLAILANTNKRVVINELSPALSHLHEMIINEPKKVKDFIKNVDLSIEEFFKQTAIRDSEKLQPIDQAALALLYCSRTCYSGKIYDKTAMTGYATEKITKGRRYHIGDRFSRKKICVLIDKISDYRENKQVVISNQDCFSIISEADYDDALLYFDPPYLGKKYRRLYGDYDDFDHAKLAATLKTERRPFIVSYADIEEIRELYKWAKILVYPRRSNICNGRKYKELLINNF